jgi:hypothetical protein
MMTNIQSWLTAKINELGITEDRTEGAANWTVFGRYSSEAVDQMADLSKERPAAPGRDVPSDTSVEIIAIARKH